jgi:hypothetical protein
VSTIIHIPRAVSNRHFPPAWQYQAAILACADLVSKYRFGCVSALLPVEQRELLIAYMEDLWRELDAAEKGRVS